jgi:hypothetical protein
MRVENELRELSFQDLMTVKNTVGSKKFDTLYKKALKEQQSESENEGESESEQEETSDSSSDKEKVQKGPKKRVDKNMPMEMSSKRPVTRKRVVVTSTNTVSICNTESKRSSI